MYRLGAKFRALLIEIDNSFHIKAIVLRFPDQHSAAVFAALVVQ